MYTDFVTFILGKTKLIRQDISTLDIDNIEQLLLSYLRKDFNYLCHGMT